MHLISTLLSLLMATSSYVFNRPEKSLANAEYHDKLFVYAAVGGPFVFTKLVNNYPPTFTANTYVPAYNSGFGYGTNMGYYGNNWTDDKIAEIFKGVGGNTLRVSLPEKFLRQWGYNIRVNTFKSYRDNLGLHDLTAMVEGPSDDVRDRTKYDGNNESNVFANLYQPIWNGDGSVNTNNYYANYIYNTVINYGDYVRFWEICNEPDFSQANTDTWYSRNPTAAELPNLKAPISHYIRMLRIAYEVIKSYKPNDYVAIGGIGYDSFLDAVLRNTDNPNGGSATADYPNKGGAYFDVLSYHYYPIYALRTWNNSTMGFDYQRHSDAAVNATLGHKALLEQTLKKYGYGASYPQKHVILTETNVGRKTTGSLYGGNEYQRNYVMKMMVQAQKNGIDQVDFFMTGETANYDQAYNENQVMGFFENMFRDAPGSQKLTPAGIGHKTIGQLLNGYIYDSGLTSQLGLPANVDGGAFKKGNDVLYILYAKTGTDMNELNTASYSFPSALNIKTLNTYDWNYSITGQAGNITGTTVQLSASPAAFKIAETNQDIANGGRNISYKYYENNGITWSDLPDFKQLSPASSGKTSVIDLSIPHRTNNYAVVFEGYINIPVSGNYTFEINSDDGSKLYLGSFDLSKSALIDNDGLHDFQYREATINLAKGVYPIAVSYMQAGGGSGLQVYWKNTAMGVTSRQLIPKEYFVSSSVENITFKYFENNNNPWLSLPDFNKLSPTATGRTGSIDLSIPHRSNNYGVIYDGYLNIPVTGNYTFEINSDDGSKLYIGNYDFNKTALVNNDGAHDLQFKEGTITLSKGIYPVSVTYSQITGGAGLKLYWKNTANGVSDRQIIPNEFFVDGSSTSLALTPINYKYFEGFWSYLPDFSKLSAVQTGVTSDIDLNIIRRPEYYGVLYETFINIPVAGNYTFETYSDDGSKIYLGNYDYTKTPIVNNDGPHGMQFAEGTVYLSKGVYPIAASYLQIGGSSGLELYWKNTAHGVTSRQRIPKEYYVNGPATTTSFTKLSVDKNSLAVDAIANQEKTAVSYITGVYPNPVSNTVFVKLGTEFSPETQVRLQLSDLSGHVLKTQNITQAISVVEMDIQPLNLFTGMYFLKVSGDKVAAKTFKVIKK